jgi:hypothetical protein
MPHKKTPLTGPNRNAVGELLLSIKQLLAAKRGVTDSDYILRCHYQLVTALKLYMGLIPTATQQQMMQRFFGNRELDAMLAQLEAAMKIVADCNADSVRVLNHARKLRWMLVEMRRRQTTAESYQREERETMNEKVYQEPRATAQVIELRAVEYRISQKLLDLYQRDTGEPLYTAQELITWANSKTPEFFLAAARDSS